MMLQRNAELTAQLYPPDIRVDIPMNRFGGFDYDKAARIFFGRRRRMREALELYEKRIISTHLPHLHETADSLLFHRRSDYNPCRQSTSRIPRKMGWRRNDRHPLARDLSRVADGIGRLSFSTRRNLFKTVCTDGRNGQYRSFAPVALAYMANKLSMRNGCTDYIVDNGFDTVVCTHLFPAEAPTALETSRTTGPETVSRHDGLYVSPLRGRPIWIIISSLTNTGSRSVSKKGLRRERLFPFGIPVRRAFPRAHCEKGGESGMRRPSGSGDRYDREVVPRCLRKHGGSAVRPT